MGRLRADRCCRVCRLRVFRYGKHEDLSETIKQRLSRESRNYLILSSKLLSHVGVSGIISGKININHETYLLLAQLRSSLMMTTFTIKSDQSVGGQSENESYKFTSLGLSFQPTFSATRKFGHFGLQALAGYNLNLLQGKLYLEDGDEAYITMDDEKPLKADWSGFRVSFGLSYQVNK